MAKPTTRTDSVETMIESRKEIWLFVALFVVITPLYFATADRSRSHRVDALTNTLAAWKLGTEGSVYIDENLPVTGGPYAGKVTWLVEVDGHAVSKYPPGTALLAAPFYAIAQPDGEPVQRSVAVGDQGEIETATVILPSFVPGVLAAAAATAMAVTMLSLVFRRFVSGRMAIAAALVAGLGTSAWSVASDALWQHGPAMMWLALALWLLSADREWPAGVMFGFSVLTRPQTAVIAAIVGLYLGVRKRNLWPVVRIGAGSLLGLGAYLLYNQLLFGGDVPVESGGYFVDGLDSGGPFTYLADLGRVFFDLERGVLLYSPFLIFLLPGIRRAWRAAPHWVQGAALGGTLYLLVQIRGNVWHGGDGFFAYRYPLEMLLLAAPLLLLAWREWVRRTDLRATLTRWSAGLAIVIHGVGAIVL